MKKGSRIERIEEVPGTTVRRSLESLYGIVNKDLLLTRRVTTQTSKYVDTFKFSNKVLVETIFPEFTCLCPKTNQPDFGDFHLFYIPQFSCIELKSLKYYLNSFRNEGHFHEEVCTLIEKDLREVLEPVKLLVVIAFNFRGGLSTTVLSGDKELWNTPH